MNARGCAIALFACLVPGTLGPLALAQDAIPLEQALANGKVDAEITGIGGSTGDVILLAVRSRTPQGLRMTLTPGTVFRSISGRVQNMAGASIRGELAGANTYRPTSEIVLADNSVHRYVVEAYCLDFHKGNPGSSDRFVLTPPDAQALKILQAGKAKGASIRAIQAAVWMIRDGVTPVQLQQRFPVTNADILIAMAILKDAAQLGPDPRTTSTGPRTPSGGAAASPAVPQRRYKPRAKFRTWTDITGKHKVQAELVAVAQEDGTVQLRKPNGNVVTVPLEKLSQEDQAFLKRQALKKPAVE